jgi:hypothetical protein
MPAGGMLGTGRSVPAWSDLTGAPANGGFASNGTNGANGFHGPRSGESIPPVPQGPEPQRGPQGFSGDGLPQRRNGDNYRPDGDSGFGGSPRQLPANPEGPGRNPFVPPVSAPPVPPMSSPPVSSAPPYGGGRPVSSPPMSGAPMSSAPVSTPPNVPAPPAWPPVSADRDGAPHVPESLAAALDMTAEIPRYRPDRSATGSQPLVERPASPQSAPPAQTEAQRSAAAAAAAHEAAAAQAAEAQATAAAQIAAAQQAARQRQADNAQSQYADETMELPIFRELESAWFTTAKPATTAAPSASLDVDDDTSPVTTQRFSTGEPARTAGVPEQEDSPESRNGDSSRDLDPATVGAVSSNGSGTNPWHTAADEGWQAARAAADAPVETTTTAGLPKRKPMAQLVPGGVDRAENSTQRRTPEAVRGLLSAYHRGVQRGRTKEQSTNPDENPGGQQSPQAGKEHEA